jgi:hypothetical protein
MKLITQELLERFKEVGDQSEVENPIFIAKFFDPTGSATWYASDYNPERNVCYGYVTGLAYDEWGTFSITELESVKSHLGIGIERDIHFSEIGFNELVNPTRLTELKQVKESKEQDIER